MNRAQGTAKGQGRPPTLCTGRASQYSAAVPPARLTSQPRRNAAMRPGARRPNRARAMGQSRTKGGRLRKSLGKPSQSARAPARPRSRSGRQASERRLSARARRVHAPALSPASSKACAALSAGSMRRRRISFLSASSTVKAQPCRLKTSPGPGTWPASMLR